MSLTVDVLEVAPLPVVRARVEVSGAWSLIGASGGDTWQVAAGSGPATVADPWAPVNVAVTYTLTSAAQAWVEGPVLRSYGGDQALTDLQGRSVVNFRHFAGGGDPWDVEPRHEFFDVPGVALSPFLSAQVAGAGGGSLTARTTGVDTAAMKALLARNVPVVMLHNHALCDIPGCDTPPARTVLVVGASSDRTGRTDVVQREWALAYRLAPVPWGFLPPVATVGDLRAALPTVGDLRTSGLTVGNFTSGEWLVTL